MKFPRLGRSGSVPSARVSFRDWDIWDSPAFTLLKGCVGGLLVAGLVVLVLYALWAFTGLFSETAEPRAAAVVVAGFAMFAGAIVAFER